MNEYLMITIESVNSNGKVDRLCHTIDSVQDGVRMMLTYKPKRGYKVVHYSIDVTQSLV